MLRVLVVVLALANLLFYAWTQGMLDNVIGIRVQGDREPERLNRQVRPDTIRVLPPSSSASLTPTALLTSTAPEPAAVCVEVGPYTPAQIAAAEGVLQTVLPAGSWANLKTERPAVWIVYMGRYTTREALQKKADELKRLKIPFDELHNVSAELDMGLALGGRYDTRAAADKALAEATQRGVRTARVATLTPPSVMHSLRVERADATLQTRLAGLHADGLQGRAFTPCARP